MAYILDATTRSLQLKLGGAITTNQLPVVATFVDVLSSDQSVSTFSSTPTVTNSGTAVTIVAAPASGHTRTLKTLSVVNADTVSATVTVIYNDNSTLRNVVVIVLDVGDNLGYDDEHGWYVVSSAGNIKTSLSGAGSGTVTHTTGGLTLGQVVYGNGTADIKAVAASDGQVPIGKTSDGTAAFATLTAGSGISVTNAANAITLALSANAKTRQITYAANGGGSALTASSAFDVYLQVEYGCTITANTVLADQSGSVVIAITKSSFSGFPGSLTSIVASAPPTLSSAQKSTDSTLTGWTTSVSAGDVLKFSISSVATITFVSCMLTVTTT